MIGAGSRNGFLESGRAGRGSSKGDAGGGDVGLVLKKSSFTGEVVRLRKGLLEARFRVRPGRPEGPWPAFGLLLISRSQGFGRFRACEMMMLIGNMKQRSLLDTPDSDDSGK